MMDDEKNSAEQALAALFDPLARLMIDNDVMLNDAIDLLKSALVEAASAKNPDISASHISLMTGVHRKDVKRFEREDPLPQRSSAAARVLTLWQTDPDFLRDTAPRPLSRTGPDGFDALVKRAKIDAAPATVLSMLIASGAVTETGGTITFETATLVPAGHSEKLKAAVATLRPHLATTVGNLGGDAPQWDQALRYSHLSDAAIEKLKSMGAEQALNMLQNLNVEAQKLQEREEGNNTFVLGTFMNSGKQDV